jgi:tRNA pseudouridine32 synthase/23S rRNA pseudouridine746 synthase
MRVRAPRPSYVAMASVTPRPATVLDFLCIRFRAIGRERWEDRMRRGLVRAEDGAPIDAQTPFREGARISYFREVLDEPEPLEEAVVLHEGDAFVIADKPHGMPVVPGGEYLGRSLVYRLAKSLGDPELAPAHRLDLDTAGLVLLVRRARDRGLFHRLFAERSIQKGYRAISSGEPPVDRYWRVRSRIVAGNAGARRQSIADPGGDSVSDVYVDRAARGHVRFLVRPETGRQHQVRLHLAGIGYPIVGDTRYPERRWPQPGEPPLQLLAAELSFRDPTTGRRHCFESSRRLGLDSLFE